MADTIFVSPAERLRYMSEYAFYRVIDAYNRRFDEVMFDPESNLETTYEDIHYAEHRILSAEAVQIHDSIFYGSPQIFVDNIDSDQPIAFSDEFMAAYRAASAADSTLSLDRFVITSIYNRINEYLGSITDEFGNNVMDRGDGSLESVSHDVYLGYLSDFVSDTGLTRSSDGNGYVASRRFVMSPYDTNFRDRDAFRAPVLHAIEANTSIDRASDIVRVHDLTSSGVASLVDIERLGVDNAGNATYRPVRNVGTQDNLKLVNIDDICGFSRLRPYMTTSEYNSLVNGVISSWRSTVFDDPNFDFRSLGYVAGYPRSSRNRDNNTPFMDSIETNEQAQAIFFDNVRRAIDRSVSIMQELTNRGYAYNISRGDRDGQVKLSIEGTKIDVRIFDVPSEINMIGRTYDSEIAATRYVKSDQETVNGGRPFDGQVSTVFDDFMSRVQDASFIPNDVQAIMDTNARPDVDAPTRVRELQSVRYMRSIMDGMYLPASAFVDTVLYSLGEPVSDANGHVLGTVAGDDTVGRDYAKQVLQVRSSGRQGPTLGLRSVNLNHATAKSNETSTYVGQSAYVQPRDFINQVGIYQWFFVENDLSDNNVLNSFNNSRLGVVAHREANGTISFYDDPNVPNGILRLTAPGTVPNFDFGTPAIEFNPNGVQGDIVIDGTIDRSMERINFYDADKSPHYPTRYIAAAVSSARSNFSNQTNVDELVEIAYREAALAVQERRVPSFDTFPDDVLHGENPASTDHILALRKSYYQFALDSFYDAMVENDDELFYTAKFGLVSGDYIEGNDFGSVLGNLDDSNGASRDRRTVTVIGADDSEVALDVPVDVTASFENLEHDDMVARMSETIRGNLSHLMDSKIGMVVHGKPFADDSYEVSYEFDATNGSIIYHNDHDATRDGIAYYRFRQDVHAFSDQGLRANTVVWLVNDDATNVTTTAARVTDSTGGAIKFSSFVGRPRRDADNNVVVDDNTGNIVYDPILSFDSSVYDDALLDDVSSPRTGNTTYRYMRQSAYDAIMERGSVDSFDDSVVLGSLTNINQYMTGQGFGVNKENLINALRNAELAGSGDDMHYADSISYYTPPAVTREIETGELDADGNPIMQTVVEAAPTTSLFTPDSRIIDSTIQFGQPKRLGPSVVSTYNPETREIEESPREDFDINENHVYRYSELYQRRDALIDLVDQQIAAGDESAARDFQVELAKVNYRLDILDEVYAAISSNMSYVATVDSDGNQIMVNGAPGFDGYLRPRAGGAPIYDASVDFENVWPDIAIDDNGVIEYAFTRETTGRVASDARTKINLVRATIGQVFVPDFYVDDMGAVHEYLTNSTFNSGEDYAFSFGLRGYFLDQNTNPGTFTERMRVLQFDESFKRGLRQQLRRDIGSPKLTAGVGSPVSLNGIYRHDRTVERYAPNAKAVAMSHGLSEEIFDKRIADSHGKVVYSGADYREGASVMSASHITRGSSEYYSNRTHDPLARVDNQSLSSFTKMLRHYFDSFALGGGKNQTDVHYLNIGADVSGDQLLPVADLYDATGHLTEAAMCNLHTLDKNRFAEHDPANRQQMEFSNDKHCLYVTPSDDLLRVAFMTLAGFEQNDGIVISKERASRMEVPDENGNMRGLRIGDKMSVGHGNKGVIAYIADPEFSKQVDLEVRSRAIRAVCGFYANSVGMRAYNVNDSGFRQAAFDFYRANRDVVDTSIKMQYPTYDEAREAYRVAKGLGENEFVSNRVISSLLNFRDYSDNRRFFMAYREIQHKNGNKIDHDEFLTFYRDKDSEMFAEMKQLVDDRLDVISKFEAALSDMHTDMRISDRVLSNLIDRRNQRIDYEVSKVFALNPTLDAVQSLHSALSRRNAGTYVEAIQLREERRQRLGDAYDEHEDDLHLFGDVVVEGGISGIYAAVLDKTAEGKTNLENGRNAGWQLSQIWKSLELTQMLSHVYGNNTAGENSIREFLRTSIGYDLTDDGIVTPFLVQHAGVDSRVLDIESVSRSVDRDGSLSYNAKVAEATFSDFLNQDGGYIELPFELSWPDNHELLGIDTEDFTPNSIPEVMGSFGTRFRMPMMSIKERQGQDSRDNEIINHDYTNHYSRILRAATDWYSSEAQLQKKLSNYGYYDSDELNVTKWIEQQDALHCVGVLDADLSEEQLAAQAEWIDAKGAYYELSSKSQRPKGLAILRKFGYDSDEQRLQFMDDLVASATSSTHKKITDDVKSMKALMSKRDNTAVRAQKSFSALSNEVATRGCTDKYNFLRTKGMSAHINGASVTSIWTPDPRNEIDEVRMGPELAKRLGVKNRADIMLWRDPVLIESNVRAFKITIDENLYGVSVNPEVAKMIAGDFDGDTVGIFAPKDAETREQIKKLLDVSREFINSRDAKVHKFTVGNETDLTCLASDHPSYAAQYKDWCDRFIEHFDNLCEEQNTDCPVTNKDTEALKSELSELLKSGFSMECGTRALSLKDYGSVLRTIWETNIETGAKGSIGALNYLARNMGVRTTIEGDYKPEEGKYLSMKVVDGKEVPDFENIKFVGHTLQTYDNEISTQTAIALKSYATGVVGKFMQYLEKALPDYLWVAHALAQPLYQMALDWKHDGETALRQSKILDPIRDTLLRGSRYTCERDKNGNIMPDSWRKVYGKDVPPLTPREWLGQLRDMYASVDKDVVSDKTWNVLQRAMSVIDALSVDYLGQSACTAEYGTTMLQGLNAGGSYATQFMTDFKDAILNDPSRIPDGQTETIVHNVDSFMTALVNRVSNWPANVGPEPVAVLQQIQDTLFNGTRYDRTDDGRFVESSDTSVLQAHELPKQLSELCAGIGINAETSSELCEGMASVMRITGMAADEKLYNFDDRARDKNSPLVRSAYEEKLGPIFEAAQVFGNLYGSDMDTYGTSNMQKAFSEGSKPIQHYVALAMEAVFSEEAVTELKEQTVEYANGPEQVPPVVNTPSVPVENSVATTVPEPVTVESSVPTNEVAESVEPVVAYTEPQPAFNPIQSAAAPRRRGGFVASWLTNTPQASSEVASVEQSIAEDAAGIEAIVAGNRKHYEEAVAAHNQASKAVPEDVEQGMGVSDAENGTPEPVSTPESGDMGNK